MSSVVEAFARQILNEEPDIVGFQRVQEATKIYLKSGKAIVAKRPILVWDYRLDVSQGRPFHCIIPFPFQQIQKFNFIPSWRPVFDMNIVYEMEFKISNIRRRQASRW